MLWSHQIMEIHKWQFYKSLGIKLGIKVVLLGLRFNERFFSLINFHLFDITLWSVLRFSTLLAKNNENTSVISPGN